MHNYAVRFRISNLINFRAELRKPGLEIHLISQGYPPTTVIRRHYLPAEGHGMLQTAFPHT
jgi:hypothetical protein